MTFITTEIVIIDTNRSAHYFFYQVLFPPPEIDKLFLDFILMDDIHELL